MKLLQVDSSARASSVSRRLTARFAEEWKKNHPEGEVIHRDLATSALPPITDEWGATYVDESQITPTQRAYLATSDQLIGELQAAETVVIGAPMYNFSISAQLKAWIDQIVRVGKTVRYGNDGPHGLLGGRSAIVITARGGSYEKGGPTAGFDFQEPYLRFLLGVVGLTDVTFIHAEKQLRPEAEASFAAATEQVSLAASEHVLAASQA
ncbi:MAG: FMN-dependent NADH-azoreductase [Terriglobales bacterium]